MAGSHKKVIVRTLANDVQCGYLPLNRLRTAAGDVEILDLDGRILPIPLSSIRWIAYVRDFNLGDAIDPERLSRRTFLARPRAEGLWLRLTLSGNEILEGLAPIDLTLIDGLLEDRGLFLIPPDIRSNTQRLFLPRTAFTDLQVVAVITTPSKTKPISEPAQKKQQDFLFPDPRS